MSGWLFLAAVAAAMAGWAVSRRPAGTILAEKNRLPGTELVEKLKRWGPLAAWEAERAKTPRFVWKPCLSSWTL